MDAKPPQDPATAWLDGRYRQVIEQVEDYAIFTLDNEGRVLSWNGGAERILGYSEKEALGREFAFIFVPEDRDLGLPRQELEGARYGGRTTDDRWHLREDGSRFFAGGVLTALHDDQGTPDGYTKILRDLTRQREAEEERARLLAELKALNETLERRVGERTEALQLQNDALNSSERRFEQVFQSGPVATCLTTLKTDVFLDVNEAFLQLTGYSKEDVLGRSLLELTMWSSKEDRDALQRFEDELGSFRDLELHLRTQGGSDRTILASGEIIDLGGDQVNLKMFYDITDRKRTEAQFMQAIQEVMTDTAWFSRQVLERLAHMHVGDGAPAPVVDLSRREREVLELVARGAGNEQIARELGIVAQTVRNYISNIYDKLGVHSRAEAVVWARERGMV